MSPKTGTQKSAKSASVTARRSRDSRTRRSLSPRRNLL